MEPAVAVSGGTLTIDVESTYPAWVVPFRSGTLRSTSSRKQGPKGAGSGDSINRSLQRFESQCQAGSVKVSFGGGEEAVDEYIASVQKDIAVYSLVLAHSQAATFAAEQLLQNPPNNKSHFADTQRTNGLPYASRPDPLCLTAHFNALKSVSLDKPRLHFGEDVPKKAILLAIKDFDSSQDASKLDTLKSAVDVIIEHSFLPTHSQQVPLLTTKLRDTASQACYTCVENLLVLSTVDVMLPEALFMQGLNLVLQMHLDISIVYREDSLYLHLGDTLHTTQTHLGFCKTATACLPSSGPVRKPCTLPLDCALSAPPTIPTTRFATHQTSAGLSHARMPSVTARPAIRTADPTPQQL
ncbi:hypothetical protein BDK51DRAFT_46557 [Blyttiomyces helicus]|uniref:Uncharacterized protein n=1 Tax=Blyttiomyces helicus TaxID=388810 RepID=A0A4P9WRS3_9FUNG|nr:hypothetical protein BDK51DRAFT_46557 [Blyttiomyces helicus]|eukprot:RKO94000.1 hypothetical protein BDK51DRAFT_46557 [Blyttiomyces helicus]